MLSIRRHIWRIKPIFLGSSAVEQSTVNRLVAGSNPARGANTLNALGRFLFATRENVTKCHVRQDSKPD